MAVICDDLKFIYFLSPGTGSSSLLSFFINNFNARTIPYPDVNLFDDGGKLMVSEKHSTYSQLLNHGLLDEKQNNYLRITGVRNLYDYFYAEWYRSKTKFIKLLPDKNSWIYKTKNSKRKIASIINAATMDFSDWLVKEIGHHYKNNTKIMFHREFVDHADVVIRREHISEDVHKILSEKLNIDKKFEMPKQNITNKDRCYWKYYSKEAREMVHSVYQPYLEKFGYVF